MGQNGGWGGRGAPCHRIFFNNFIHGFMDQQLQHRSRSRALQRRPKRPRSTVDGGRRQRSAKGRDRRRSKAGVGAKYPAASTTKIVTATDSPTSVLYCWGTGAVAISGRFSTPPPPRKRPSRPSLSLYLGFPLTSTLTLANTCCERPLPSLQVRVRVRAPASATSAAAATTAAAAKTKAEVSVSMGVARAHARADNDGSGGD